MLESHFNPKDFTPQLPESVEFILSQLQMSGYKAYIVGGCVRDMILHTLECSDNAGLKSDLTYQNLPSDYDIATSALPSEVIKLFPRTIPTGLKHGTISVIYKSEVYEISTFRIEGAYSNKRAPDSVRFTTELELDLQRRDFTMNALAYSPQTGLIDKVNGLRGIINRKIICVGEAHLRFNEDALRILRALRFAATLDFEIESHTDSALRECAKNLCFISKERIRDELTKLLCGRAAEKIMRKYGDVLCVAFGGMISFEGLEVRLPQNIESKAFIWALFLAQVCDGGKTSKRDKADKILESLKFDNKTRRYVSEILKACEISLELDKQEIAGRIIALGGRETRGLEYCKQGCVNGGMGLSISGERILRDMIRLKMAVVAQDSTQDLAQKGLKEFQKAMEQVLDSNLPLSLKELCINGEDLKRVGIVGKDIGRILQILLEEIASEKLKHSREALLIRAGELRG
ncbi:CCA tRNA nucleotidyltransferase [Helicobacter cinaedi]|uniref:Poly(A) polymerase n=1 Tax=Helicobacter cinaedi TaxID=213 RepID=A0A377JP55_9HELI|nr:[cytidine(C)-cytidine(C)-adenosine (A)]-adding enzyme [Helicobacter cinaedi]STP09570.1 poly(A) polymerase [Helicobacter cinaedi]